MSIGDRDEAAIAQSHGDPALEDLYGAFHLRLGEKRIADGDDGGPQVFTVTHPFHPLKGQTFEVLAARNNWGGDRVSYLDATGRLRTFADRVGQMLGCPIRW